MFFQGQIYPSVYNQSHIILIKTAPAFFRPAVKCVKNSEWKGGGGNLWFHELCFALDLLFSWLGFDYQVIN